MSWTIQEAIKKIEELENEEKSTPIWTKRWLQIKQEIAYYKQKAELEKNTPASPPPPAAAAATSPLVLLAAGVGIWWFFVRKK